MLQYLINPSSRYAHDFINQLEFLTSDSGFKNANFQKLRAIIKRQELERDTDFFAKCFQSLEQSKPKPKQMLKILIFIHLLLQTNVTKSDDMFTLLNKQTSSILTKSKMYCQSKHKAATPAPAVVLTTQCFDDSDSPRSSNVDQMIGSTSDASNEPKSNKIYRVQSVNSENSHISSRNSQTSEKQQDYVSEKQILCQKIIEPYAFYLMKKCFFGVSRSVQSFDSKQVQQIHIWQQLNILKLISQITSNFFTIGRYYDKKLLKLTIKFCPLLSHDIHNIYPKLASSIKQKVQNVARKQALNSTKSTESISNKKVKGNKQNKLNCSNENQNQRKTQISQCKELLAEIAECNQRIMFFYMNKYIVDYLGNIGVHMPELMSLDTAQCEYIYFKVQEDQKKAQKQLRKSELIKKCRSNTLQNFSKIRKSTTCLRSDDCRSPTSPIYQAMTPNRLPRRSKNLQNAIKNISSLANIQIDELDEDRE